MKNSGQRVISPGETWFRLLDDVFQEVEHEKGLFSKLGHLYQFTKDLTPKHADIFRAFELTDFNDVKVVIVGQDPYPTPGVADGLAFSTRSKETPASLKNIFKELKEEYGKIPKTNDLSFWAKQGVLLLNRTLTVEIGKPGSHRNWGWEKITEEAISLLLRAQPGVIYVLWGQDAQKLVPMIRKAGERFLFAAHPSPLSAHRGFLGCGHFKKVNEMIERCSIYGPGTGTPIDWIGR